MYVCVFCINDVHKLIYFSIKFTVIYNFVNIYKTKKTEATALKVANTQKQGLSCARTSISIYILSIINLYETALVRLIIKYYLFIFFYFKRKSLKITSKNIYSK